MRSEGTGPRRERRSVLPFLPGFLGRVFTGALRALGIIAKTMGARPVASLFVGMIAQEKYARPPGKALRKARAAGRKLAGG